MCIYIQCMCVNFGREAIEYKVHVYGFGQPTHVRCPSR